MPNSVSVDKMNLKPVQREGTGNTIEHVNKVAVLEMIFRNFFRGSDVTDARLSLLRVHGVAEQSI